MEVYRIEKVELVLEEPLETTESAAVPVPEHPPEKKTVHPRHPPRPQQFVKRMLLVILLCGAALLFLRAYRAQEQAESAAAQVVNETPVVEEPAVYQAVFTTDGVEVAAVEYEEGAVAIEEPAVPEKKGYVGAWEDYALDGDVTVKAVYTYEPWDGVVYGDDLCIYIQPSAAADTVVTLKTGDVVTVIDETVVDETVWYETSDGWMQKISVANGAGKGTKVAASLGITLDGDWTIRAETAAELAEAMAVVTDRGYRVAFVLVDLESGHSIRYNADDEFYCASTIKAPYVCSVLSRYPEAASSYGGTMQDVLVNSSNSGYTALRNRYGVDCFADWCSEAGVEIETSKKWPAITAEELCKLWMQSYEFFTTSETGAAMAQWFENPASSPIHKVLGKDYTTQTKAGWIRGSSAYYQAASDAGIVYADGGTYAVAILSDACAKLTLIEPLVGALDAVHDEMNAEK